MWRGCRSEVGRLWTLCGAGLGSVSNASFGGWVRLVERGGGKDAW